MRNMSFMLTTEQIRNKTKCVTRRRGWKFLKPGDHVMACVKCMGLKKGEKIEKIAPLCIVDVRREPLVSITPDDVEKEGFPGRSPEWFINMFCVHMGVDVVGNDFLITRIEFEYLYTCMECKRLLVFDDTVRAGMFGAPGDMCWPCYQKWERLQEEEHADR